MTKVTGESGRKIELDLRPPLLLFSLAAALLVACVVLGSALSIMLSGVMMITVGFALGWLHLTLKPLPDDYTHSGKSINWMVPAARICCAVGAVILGLYLLAWLVS